MMTEHRRNDLAQLLRQEAEKLRVAERVGDVQRVRDALCRVVYELDQVAGDAVDAAFSATT